MAHGDVRPANLLIDDEGTASLVDFGLAGFFDRNAASPAAIATDRAGMLWAGEGMPHRFDACCEISDIARRLRAQSRDVASRSESPDPRRRPHR